MRYLIACDDFFPDRPSGAARVAWDLATAMRDRGHDVCSVCLNQRPGELPDGLGKAEGIAVVRYTPPPRHAMDPRRLTSRLAAAAGQVRRSLGSGAWDLLHIHSPLTGRAVADACPDVGRLVYTAHSPVVLEQQINWSQQGWRGRVKGLLGTGVLRRMEGGLMRAAQHVHVLSEFTKKQLEAQHDLGARVVVSPHWVRPEYHRTLSHAQARQALGWTLDVPTFFTIRRHVHRMGLDVAIEAVAPLARAGRCRLVIGGDGPLRADLQRQASEAGCSEQQVQFLGQMTDEALLLAYQAADLFILPTRALECFGLIAQEAMAFGCPVLGTDVGAIPEMLRPAAPELIVPIEDPGSMQRCMEGFLAETLAVPQAKDLAADTLRRYGRDAVLPRLLALLEHGESGKHQPAALAAAAPAGGV
jgi:glycosyltransferase involved in cell wall biosynthesis